MAKGKPIGLKDAMTLGLFFDAPVNPTLPLASSIRQSYGPDPGGAPQDPSSVPISQQRRVELDTERLDTPATRISRGIQ